MKGREFQLVREYLDMTQERMAAALGMNLRRLKMIEKGRFKLTIGEIARVWELVDNHESFR